MRIFEGDIMPKKKLTKATVRKKMKQMLNILTDLLMDKVGYPDSFVTLPTKKMLELSGDVSRAFKRIK
jgi:hypothetical protein